MNLQNKKIMVTGGAGFIGSHTVDALIKRRSNVVVVDNLVTGRKENLNPKTKFYEMDICGPEISDIGISENKIVSYVEWVDENRFKPREKKECKRRLGWQGKFIILFVGRAIPIKGADTLIEVAKRTNKNIYFAFISDAGPQVKMLKKAARETENVIFVGGVDHKDLHWYYRARWFIFSRIFTF